MGVTESCGRGPSPRSPSRISRGHHAIGVRSENRAAVERSPKEIAPLALNVASASRAGSGRPKVEETRGLLARADFTRAKSSEVTLATRR